MSHEDAAPHPDPLPAGEGESLEDRLKPNDMIHMNHF
jgi:hypothetical protein